MKNPTQQKQAIMIRISHSLHRSHCRHCILIPLVLEVSGLRLPGAVPAALVLVGGFILRYVIVMANA